MARITKNSDEIREAAETMIKKAEQTIETQAEIIKPAAEKALKDAADKAAETGKKVTERVKKTTAGVKKTVKKIEPKKTSLVFEANGKSFNYDDVVKAVNKACKGKTAKKLEIYVNANEGAAYYVLDGVASPEYKVEL